MVVVDVLPRGNFPRNRNLDRAHAAAVRRPAHQGDHGPDRFGK